MSTRTGSIRAEIGADITSYVNTMSAIPKATMDAFDAAQKAAQQGGNVMEKAFRASMAAVNSLIVSGTNSAMGEMVSAVNLSAGRIQRIFATIGEKVPEIFKSLNKDIFQPMYQGAVGVTKAIGNAFMGLGSIVNRGLIQPTIKGLQSIWNTASDMFQIVSEMAQSLARIFQNTIGKTIIQTGKLVSDYIIKPTLEVGKAYYDVAKDIIQSVGGAIQTVGKLTYSHIIEPTMEVAKAYYNTAKTISKTVGKAIQTVGRTIYDYIIQPTLEVAQHYVQIAKTILQTVGGAVRSVGTTIYDYLIAPTAEVIAAYANVAKEIVQRVGGAFAEVGRRLVSDLKGPLEQIGTAIGNTITIAGKGFMQLPSFATSAVNQVADAMNPLIQVASNVAQRMTDSFNRGFNNMSQGAAKGLNKISDHFAKGTGGANSFRSSVMQLASAFSLASLATKGIQAITNSFDSAIDRYDTLNQFPRIMEMWGYSADETKKSTDRLVDGIDGLPTKLDDIASNVQELVVSGLDLTTATDVAIAFNDAMLANGSSADQAKRSMEQYNRMLATGEVTMDAWQSLQRGMGKALNTVAEEMLGAGKNSHDLYVALDEGKITIEDFNKAMIEADQATGGFAEQALEGTQGIKTAFSNLATAVSRNVADIIKVIDQHLESKGLDNLATTLTDLRGTINNIGEKVQEVIPGALDSLMDLGLSGSLALLAIPSVLPSVMSAIGTFGGSKGLGGLGLEFINLGSGATRTTGNIVDALGETTKATSGFKNTLAMAAQAGISTMGTMANGMLSLAGVALSAIGPAAILGLVVAAIGYVATAFDDQINSMLKLVQQKAPEVITNFINGIVEKLPELINAGTEMIHTLVLVIVDLLPLIVDAGMLLLETLVGGIGDNMPLLIESTLLIVSTILEQILIALPELLTMGMELLLSLVQGIMENMDLIVESVTNILNSFVQSVVENLPLIIEAGIQIILELINGLTEMLPQLLEVGFFALMSLVQGIFENVPLLLDGAVMIVQSLINFIVENLPMIIMMGMQLIFAVVEGVIQNLPMLIMAGLEIIFSILQGMTEMLPDLVAAGIELVFMVIQGILENLPQILVAGIQLVFEFVAGIFEMLPDIIAAGWEIIKALGKGLLEAIPNVLTSAWDGIKSGFSSAYDFITGKSRETGSEATTDSSAMSSQMQSDARATQSSISSSYDSMSNSVIGSTSTMSNSAITDVGAMKERAVIDTGRMATTASTDSSKMSSDVISNSSKMSTETSSNFSKLSKDATGSIETMQTDVSSGFQNISTTANTETQGMGSNVSKEVNKMTTDIGTKTKEAEKVISNSFKSMQKTVSTSLRATNSNVQQNLTRMVSTFSSRGASIRSSATSTANAVQSSFSTLSGRMYSLGMQAGLGFQRGLNARRSGIIGSARSIANAVTSTIRSALSIHSPSRAMEKLADYTGQGFAGGLMDWVSKISAISGDIANALLLEEYQLDAGFATSASIESSGVSSRLDDLSDDVRNTERPDSTIEVHNEIIGDEIYTTVKTKDARKENKDKYFK